MTGAEFTGRNPVTFPKRARECALGVVSDRCPHVRQGAIRRAEALACQTKPQLAQEAERRKIALPAEDPNQGRARNMRFRRKLVQRPWMRGGLQHGGDACARAIVAAPGGAVCSSSSIACTSICIRSNRSFLPMLSTIAFGKAAVTRLYMAPSKRSRPQISL